MTHCYIIYRNIKGITIFFITKYDIFIDYDITFGFKYKFPQTCNLLIFVLVIASL